MTKADIVHAVYSTLGGFSKKEAADLVELVFETMKETLGRGEKIKVSGFGNFVLHDKVARQGRNPQSGDPITISARRVLNFKASQLLKQALNVAKEPQPAAPPTLAAMAGQQGGIPPGAARSAAPTPPQEMPWPAPPFTGGQQPPPTTHAHPPPQQGPHPAGTFPGPSAAFPPHQQPAPVHYGPPVPPPPAPNPAGGNLPAAVPGQFPPESGRPFPGHASQARPHPADESRESAPPPRWTPKDGQ